MTLGLAGLLHRSIEAGKRNPRRSVRLTNPQRDWLDVSAPLAVFRGGNQIGKSFAQAVDVDLVCRAALALFQALPASTTLPLFPRYSAGGEVVRRTPSSLHTYVYVYLRYIYTHMYIHTYTLIFFLWGLGPPPNSPQPPVRPAWSVPG